MAGKFQNTPLDEIQFRRPEVLQYWGGYQPNTVHPIIRESPFFDHTSKNGLLWDQAQNDWRTWEMCNNRVDFETKLKSMNGVEYLIVGEPQKVDDPALVDTGVWVIRKQDRKKRAGREDDVTVLGTYYVVGENMYQAPSVYDIVGNHLLSAITSLTKFNDLAKPLPVFTPAIGYGYYPPTSGKPATSKDSALTQSSRESSVTPSVRAGQSATPALEAASQTGSTTVNATAQAPDPRESHALLESFHLMMAYGDEYMDENPLRGQPGNFTYSATKERLRAKAAEAEAAKARAAELAKKLEEARLAAAATPFAGTATAAKTKNGAAGSEGRAVMKRSKTGDKRKRKSRNATSPTSPMTPATPATPAS